MASRLNYYLVKIARVSGWLLFVLVLIYIVTGFALCGDLGFEKCVQPSHGAVTSTGFSNGRWWPFSWSTRW